MGGRSDQHRRRQYRRRCSGGRVFWVAALGEFTNRPLCHGRPDLCLWSPGWATVRWMFNFIDRNRDAAIDDVARELQVFRDGPAGYGRYGVIARRARNRVSVAHDNHHRWRAALGWPPFCCVRVQRGTAIPRSRTPRMISPATWSVTGASTGCRLAFRRQMHEESTPPIHRPWPQSPSGIIPYSDRAF